MAASSSFSVSFPDQIQLSRAYRRRALVPFLAANFAQARSAEIINNFSQRALQVTMQRKNDVVIINSRSAARMGNVDGGANRSHVKELPVRGIKQLVDANLVFGKMLKSTQMATLLQDGYPKAEKADTAKQAETISEFLVGGKVA